VGILIIVIGIYLVVTEHITQRPHLDRHFVIIAALVPIDLAYALLVKLFLSDADPIALAVSIYLLSAVLLAVVSFVMRKRTGLTAASLRPHLRIVIPASLCAAAGAGLTYTALSLANASKVYPMAGISSVVVFLLATVFLKEKFHKHRLVGTLIVCLGIYLISLS
jgi:drug/metabolite transporter (DMT)-like permease